MAPCSPASGTCGPYITATNLASSASNCQTSKLYVTMATNVSGQLAECRDMSVGLPGTLIGSASFKIQGTALFFTLQIHSTFLYMHAVSGSAVDCTLIKYTGDVFTNYAVIFIK